MSTPTRSDGVGPAGTTTGPPAEGRDAPRRHHRLDKVRAAQRYLLTTAQIILGAILVVDVLLVVTNVITRELLNTSPSWIQPASEIAVLMIGFLGGAVAFSTGNHITVDYLTRRLGERGLGRLGAASDCFALVLAVLTCVWAIRNYPAATTRTVAGLTLTEGLYAIVLAVGVALVALNSALRLLDHDWPEILAGMAVAAAVFGVAFGGGNIPRLTGSPGAVLVLCTVLSLLVIVAGMPLTVGLWLFITVYTIAGNEVTSFVPDGLTAGLTSFVLLAIPFFILVGYLMTEGGLGRAIMALLSPVLRRLPGGNLQLVVGTMFLFSGVTGAKVADVTAVGSAMTETLVEDDGFERAEVACVMAACASAGETIPPSIALLLLGSVTSISIGTLFVAGIVPAAIIMVIIAIMIAVRDRRGLIRSTGRTTDWSQGVGLSRRVIQGALAIGLPVLLLVGIESGVLTATESSAAAVIYAVLATLVSTPRVGLRQLWQVVQTAASMAGLLLFLIAISSTIGTAAALAQVPQHIAESLANASSSKIPFLLLTIVIVPIAGALLEGLPAVLIFAPLFVPTAELLGINLVHYGIVFVVALGIGAFSPLLGVGFYTSCKVTGSDVTAATRRYWTYFICLMAGLVIVAFVPQITLAVPQLLHYTGV